MGGNAIISQNPFHQHSIQQDYDFSRVGKTYTTDSNPVTLVGTDKYYYYIEVLTDGTEFSELTVLTGSNYEDNGTPLVGASFSRGDSIRGLYESYTLASGDVMAHKMMRTGWENWGDNVQQKYTP